jgi:hypothetical protein
MEGPGVIASELLISLDQQHASFRVVMLECQSQQAALQPTAY